MPEPDPAPARPAAGWGNPPYDEWTDRGDRLIVRRSPCESEPMVRIIGITADASQGIQLSVADAVRVRDALDVFIEENQETP